jgi:hypothetical protein
MHLTAQGHEPAPSLTPCTEAGAPPAVRTRGHLPSRAMSPTPPFGPPDATAHLAEAGRLADDADDAARLASAVPWDSPAADELRMALARWRALLDGDRAAIASTRRLVAGGLP